MHWINLIIPGVILIPNLIYFWQSPSGRNSDWEEEKPFFLTVVEWVGRVGVILTPIFTKLEIQSVGEDMDVFVMIVFLLIYYAAWIRYFAYEMEYKYLFIPLLGIPLPLAISPVIYFLFASYPLHSIPLLISTIIFGISHIWISLRRYRQYKLEVSENGE